MDEESTGGIGFFRELPAHVRRIHSGNGIPPGNYQLMGAGSDRQDQNARKILLTVTIPGYATPNTSYCAEIQTFKNI
jgi:hypothetical protein